MDLISKEEVLKVIEILTFKREQELCSEDEELIHPDDLLLAINQLPVTKQIDANKLVSKIDKHIKTGTDMLDKTPGNVLTGYEKGIIFGLYSAKQIILEEVER